MEIREDENFLELLCVETAPAGLPNAGDRRLSVRVASAGFSGTCASVWVDAEAFERFLGQLRALDAGRQGFARLESLGSPDEFWLEFRAIDRAGHLAVFGRLRRWQVLSIGEGHHQTVEFGFEFGPSRLPGVMTGFEQVAARRA